MTTRLILVCHAPTAATRAARLPADEPLDKHGTNQARSAIGSLRRLDQVCRGPETRCQETAAALGLNAVIDPMLADLDAGTWRGHSISELEHNDPAALHTWLTDPDAAPHHGESVRELLSRVTHWLAELPSTGRVLAITHPSVIRAAVVHALSAPPESLWRIDVTPLSQTRLSGNNNRWTLRETGHLLAPAAGETVRALPCELS